MTEQPAQGRQGAARPIVQVGDAVLSTACQPVTEFGEDLQQLIADMFASMYAADGVGLAANQIGVGLRVFVYDCPEGSSNRVGVVVNPQLQELPAGDRNLVKDTEGCLSVRGAHAELARPDVATVVGQDAAGERITVTGTGFFARCLQHECDHLEGMLYIDRLSARARKKALREYAEQQ